MKRIFLLLLVLCFTCNLAPTLHSASFAFTAQAKKRDNRAALFEEYVTLKVESYKRYNKALYKMAKSCAKFGLLDRATEIYEEIQLNDSKFKDLEKLAEAIDNAEEEDNEKKLSSNNKKYVRAQKNMPKCSSPLRND